VNVFSQFEGTVSAADETPRLIEGRRTSRRWCRCRFPASRLRRWTVSDEYPRMRRTASQAPARSFFSSGD